MKNLKKIKDELRKLQPKEKANIIDSLFEDLEKDYNVALTMPSLINNLILNNPNYRHPDEVL